MTTKNTQPKKLDRETLIAIKTRVGYLMNKIEKKREDKKKAIGLYILSKDLTEMIENNSTFTDIECFGFYPEELTEYHLDID